VPEPASLLHAAACALGADALNQGCQCITLDRAALHRELARLPHDGALHAMIAEARPHLFSDSVVFVSERHLARMAEAIAAIERVVALPAYVEQVLAQAPPVAGHPARAHGVFLGYDFHVGAEGPRLIEVNTNAGGALLNAVLLRAQRACCAEVADALPWGRGEEAEAAFFEMFLEEWRAERGESAPLRSVAIVDERPAEQYLLPEFLLFQRLFERHGLRAEIADPAELELSGGRLRLRGRPLDLVYDRLTDFHLAAPASAALRQAWLEGSVVLTPHPRCHALYADKRNLALWSDPAALRELGADDGTAALLAEMVPRTETVRAEDADSLWARRRQLFFKPAGGFASRGAYRGDKLTKRVFQEILAGRYVAQALVPPGERRVSLAGTPTDLKADVRHYVYRGRVQLVAARLYQGQTTNLRTPGGGFAPVVPVPAQKV
jgi:hypothetical protein